MPLPKSKKNHPEHRSHPLVFILAVVMGGFLIYPFIAPLMLAVITSYVLRPVVARLENHTRSYHLALGILVAVISIPIIIAASYILSNSSMILSDISGLGDKIKDAISAVSGAISSIGLGAYAGYFLSAQEITLKITAFLISIGSDFIRSIPIYLLDFLVYLYATYHFMQSGPKIVNYIRAYAATLPAEDEHFVSSIMMGLKRSFDVLFLSYIVMSLIIGAVSFIIYSIFGVPHALLLAIVTGLFGFLPIFGVWMVYIPVAAYMYYAGNIIAAAGVLALGFVVLTVFLPFVLQPYLGARKTGISPLTVLVSFFAGPLIFGAKGLLLGPILLVITETIIVEYMRYRMSNENSKA